MYHIIPPDTLKIYLNVWVSNLIIVTVRWLTPTSTSHGTTTMQNQMCELQVSSLLLETIVPCVCLFWLFFYLHTIITDVRSMWKRQCKLTQTNDSEDVTPFGHIFLVSLKKRDPLHIKSLSVAVIHLVFHFETSVTFLNLPWWWMTCNNNILKLGVHLDNLVFLSWSPVTYFRKILHSTWYIFHVSWTHDINMWHDNYHVDMINIMSHKNVPGWLNIMSPWFFFRSKWIIMCTWKIYHVQQKGIFSWWFQCQTDCLFGPNLCL